MTKCSPEVLVTLTSDLGKVLSSLHEVKIEDKLNFVSGLQVAQVYTNKEMIYLLARLKAQTK